MITQALLETIILFLSYIDLGLTLGITIILIIKPIVSLIEPSTSPNEQYITNVLNKLTEPTLSRVRQWVPINYKGIDFSTTIVIIVAMVGKIFINGILIPIIYLHL